MEKLLTQFVIYRPNLCLPFKQNKSHNQVWNFIFEHFATSIGKFKSQWELCDGHQGQDQGQRRPCPPLPACNPGLHAKLPAILVQAVE